MTPEELQKQGLGKSWSELNDDQKEFWNKDAKEHSATYFLVDFVMKKNRCHMCKAKVNSITDLIFHVQSTHGIRYGDFVSILKELDQKYETT